MRREQVTGNAKIRQEHRLAVLNFIRRSGPVSRTEIFKHTKISKPTITRIIDNLLRDGIVRESGVGESSGGRKPVQLELNPSAYYCIGVNVSRNTIRAALVDLSMKVIHRKLVSIKGIKDVNVFCSNVETIVRELYKECDIDDDKVLGIGIGIPGIVDFNEGVVLDFASAHSLTNIPLKEYMEKAFSIKVFVDNNANTRALGEYWYGFGVGYSDLIFVIASEGIGSGIITNGKILRGKNNVTGELGHMTVNIDGRQCNCGRYGCIEAYCSTEAIENSVREALRRGRSSLLLNYVDDIECVDYQLIGQCADRGDPLCLDRLEEAACMLSTGLSNLIGILNPELVILSGDLFDAGESFFNMVEDMTKKRLFSPFTQDIIFKKRKVHDNLYEIGAAALVFKHFFKD